MCRLILVRCRGHFVDFCHVLHSVLLCSILDGDVTCILYLVKSQNFMVKCIVQKFKFWFTLVLTTRLKLFKKQSIPLRKGG